MMILEQFGSRIKDLRNGQSMSQVELSENTGITRGQISRIENGKTNVTLETIYKFCLAFEISIPKLMDFDMKLENKTNYKARPFVKWAGGKTQLLETIKDLMPKKYNTYYEPFVGGGALFLNLEPKIAVVNDFNSELITTYNCFRDKRKFNSLVNRLKEHEDNHSEEYFYEIRKQDRNESFNSFNDYEIAARFIYLNKSGYNGLYRVNSKNQFNVPSGKKKSVKTYDVDNFNSLFEYISSHKIVFLNEDFEKSVLTAKKDDFVYFDPPYDVYDDKDSFTSYSKLGFGKQEQIRLSDVFKKLDKKGVKVMLSNHNTPFIKELYKDFNQKVVLAKRMINSKSNGRGSVEEVLITNY